MHRISVLGAAVVAMAAPCSSAQGANLQYEFDVEVVTNFITSGAFAGVMQNEVLTVTYTVDSSIAPTTSEPGESVWGQGGASAGTLITEVSVTGSSLNYTQGGAGLFGSTITIVNDRFDQDVFQIIAQSNDGNPDFAKIDATLFSFSASTANSSLLGTALPTTSAELDPASFPITALAIDGPGFDGRLNGPITAVRVTPAPGALALFGAAGLGAMRRRR